MARTLLFGSSGQLGAAFHSAATETGLELVVAPRSVDLRDAEAVAGYVASVAPAWVVNAAAMTNVDAAHLDPTGAMAVNGLGPGHLAQAAQECGAKLVHVSTEAVFDGERASPYREEDACRPVSVYGASKVAGEDLVSIYSPDSFVLRTSWLYSGGTGSNFPTRLLDQLADPTREVSVVTDIVGNPTPTSVLADAMLAVMRNSPEPGTYHVCCRGAASKFDWAVEIADSAGYGRSRITATTSDEFPTVALRPKHVDLDCGKFSALGLMDLPTWREGWSQISRSAR